MVVSINTRQAYSEIDEFLRLLSNEQRNKIPQKLRELFNQERDKEYIKRIDPTIPIKEQNLKEETLAIIALLNLQYWCEDENEKQRLKEVYAKNEQIYQEMLQEKYNPNDLFKKRTTNIEKEHEQSRKQMENNRSIQQIAQNLGEYISSVSTQIDDKGKLQYYLCGSLATMLLSNATSIENCDIGENSVMNIQEKKTISQEAREDLSLFARPIHDIDVINVSGNMVYNSKVNIDGRIKNRMLRVPVQRAIPDIEQLFKDQPSFWSAFSSIDSLEEERKIVKHRVAKITIGENKEIYITAPEALIAHKLEESIQLCSQKNDLEKYEKDIKDLATMISGISKIYDKKDLVQGILDTIKEKDCSHFVEHKSELDDIFANITNDIENYISKNGLQDRLKFRDIREVLEGVYSIKKGQNLRGKGTETRLLASAIEATEEVTRSSTINNQAQNIKMIDKKKEETEKGTENR